MDNYLGTILLGDTDTSEIFNLKKNLTSTQMKNVNNAYILVYKKCVQHGTTKCGTQNIKRWRAQFRYNLSSYLDRKPSLRMLVSNDHLL
jgi:translation initiation factor 2 beta subunit (eIF-2beta)/eIF-5